MSWLNGVVEDFGRSLGIEALNFNDSGIVSLKFERLGDFFIERGEGSVLLYLVREIDRPGPEIYSAALELCHWRNQQPFHVNPALSGDRQLVFAVNLEEQKFNVPTIEQILHHLGQLHDQAFEGVTA